MSSITQSAQQKMQVLSPFVSLTSLLVAAMSQFCTTYFFKMLLQTYYCHSQYSLAHGITGGIQITGFNTLTQILKGNSISP